MLQTYERRGPSLTPIPFAIVAVLLAIFGAYQMVRGLPAIEATSTIAPEMVLGERRPLPLPVTGASAVAVDGLGTLGGNAAQIQLPIASVTKVMTAYVVLKEAPLATGQSGPTVTIAARDVTRYLQMIAQDQSALPVSVGLQLTQLELLQGLLVPSANNFAEILAVWNAGSVEAFVTKMNAEARSLGMTSTTYADPSGFSSRSLSTVDDQLLLAREAMKNALFAQLVSMQQVRLPGIGLVSSTNTILGQDGIVGIKTGFTEEAGGNLVFASRRDAGGRQVEIRGAVLAQANRPAAFEAARRIVTSVGQGVQPAKVVSAGQPVATLKAEWGDEIEVMAAEDVQFLLWPGMILTTSVGFDEIEAPLAAGSQVGWLNLDLGEQQRRVPIVLARDLPKAGVLWRLTRF